VTDTMDPTAPPPGGGDRIEPVDIQQEMQNSYIDYAMSVIVGRALPLVEDGLKPVHRRVLYSMFDSGFRPDRSFVKCARVVGDVMGNYHPHGDSAIYDALVRLAQPWSMRYPLIEGQGNFGSPGNDPAAAMRYCVTGVTRVRMADGSSVPIGEILPGAVPNSDNPVDLKVVDRSGNPVRAEMLFHSGEHSTLRLRTREGYELTGTPNHPVLCLVNVLGIPTLLWKLLEEIRPGDRIALQRTPHQDLGVCSVAEASAAFLLGAFVSEGFVSAERAGFNNVDEDFFNLVRTTYDTVVGGSRYVHARRIGSGSPLYVLDIQDLTALRRSVLAEVTDKAADKRVPDFIWTGSAARKRVFLRALFTGDGSCSALHRSTVRVSYSTYSEQLAKDVQQLLLEFGIISRRYLHATGERKVVITNRRDARLFATRIGFLGVKQDKLTRILGAEVPRSTSMSDDHVPGLAEFLRVHGASTYADRDWLRRHNVDRIERWEERGEEILAHITDADARAIAQELTDGRFYYAEVSGVTDAGVQPVYSIRVDTEDH
jgi:DNA gyrase subunit A